MTALVVLTKVLPPEALEDVSGLLSEAQAHKLAMIAADLQRLQSSPLLASVPPDNDTCHRVADLEVEAKTAIAELERSRKDRTEALRNEVSRINDLYGYITTPMKDVATKASRLVVAWNQAERARIQREEDEQRRKQEEAARAESEAMERAARASNEAEREKAMKEAEAASRSIAVAQVAEPTPAPRAYKSSAGTVSVVKKIVMLGFDPEKVPQRYYRHPDVQEALRKVLAAAVRAGYHDIEGVTVGEEEGTRARR